MAETASKTVIDVLNDYGIQVTAELTDNLEHENHVATGNLASSIRYQTKILGQLYSFELFMADYWKWVDKGRKPGKQPPRKAILAWLTAKRLGSYIYGKGKNKAVGKKSILATNLQAQKSLAYLIARKIARYGIKPTNFYTNTFKPDHAGDVKALEKDLTELLKRDVKVVIQEINETK